ncbi:leucine-rich repeat domain-containing protein [Legionella sp. D16C41]|uniref:leucine-rich repeat domain-containing protein n=1 Tax=Legionella sp. D16C41 TaxID=3402688 RepID=UPI003AF4FAA4
MKLSEDGKILLAVSNEDINSDGSFTFPESVIAIGYAAFEECTDLRTLIIPRRVTSIDAWAFWNCTNLQNLVLHEGITSINNCTFHSCISLENLIILGPVKAINEGAFYNCTKLKSIILPKELTHLGKSAFDTCKDLEAIYIPQTIIAIGHWAFEDCPKLKAIFTDDNDKALAQVKKLLPIKLAFKVVSIAQADKTFRALYESQLTKTVQTPKLNSEPGFLSFFNDNKNSAIPHESNKESANSLDKQNNEITLP